ncbi:SNF2 family N-terminal domain-containing protein [Trichoderma barbatum]
MPSSPLQTPPGGKQRRDKSRKRATERKRESHKRIKSTTRNIKTEADQTLETQPVQNPTQGIFSRFMRQQDDEHSQSMRVTPKNDGEHGNQGATTSEIEKPAAQQKAYPDTSSAIHSTSPLAHCNKSSVIKYSNKPETVVEVEGAPLNEARQVQNAAPPKADKMDLDNCFSHIKQQESDENTILPSLIKRNKEGSPQDQQDADSTRQLSNKEEENGTASETPFQDGASEEAVGTMKCDEMEDGGQSTIPDDAMDTRERSHKKKGKKRKHKRSRKGSRSRERSKSSKRRKSSESFTPDDEQEHAESSDDKEESANEFDVEQARARIPKGCSVRHEGDQKEELRAGKKIAKSKRFTKMMTSTLTTHQLTALSWMVKKEKEIDGPVAGGILAHKMGLGKTVTSLACIAANRLPRKNRKKTAQATLVIVPNQTVAIQWLSETKKHWHEEASSLVTMYNSGDHRGPRQYSNQWIVLATYGQLRNHLPSAQVMDSLYDQYADDPDTLRREFKKEAKDLLLIEWFRVIIDEGHEATRWDGRTLDACCHILAKHRWVLSGTPIQNKSIGEAKRTAKGDKIGRCRADKTMPEFYSYATFLRCKIIGTRREFRNQYIVKDATNDDFDTFASIYIYRSTTDEKLDIPSTTHREVYIEISKEEEIICKYVCEFYESHESKQQKEKEKAEMPIYEDEQDEDEEEDSKPEEEDSDSKKKERSIQPSRQLRLRQALAHPYCLENFFMGKYFSDDGCKSLASELKAISEEKKTVIEQLEADEDWGKNLGLYQAGIDELKSRKEVVMGGNFDMNEIMDLVLLQRSVNLQKCGGTTCESQDLSRFSCGHMYCGTCLGRLMTEKSNLPEAERNGHIKCSIDDCGQELLFGQSVSTLEKLAINAIKDKNYVEIGRDSLKTTVQTRLEGSLFFVASSLDPKIVPPPSSRLTATMAVAMTWLKEAHQDKIIIFTQFIATLKMLGYLFETLGVKFVYFSGALSKQKQKRAMDVFWNDPETMVMISTLKSGGQSHNITIANRVIIADLWWNKAAEMQAIGRVVRMGQKKETYSVRIVTKHSMDDRVIEVQTVKEGTIARMLQDDGHVPTEVDDERLEKIFERKEGEQRKSRKRRVKEEPSE